MRVSIIIPIFKAELYILDCFDSISSQTYKDLEIIFVDDGSPDNSGRIADELSYEHDNVKVLHQSNRGASAARNSGVKVATGDYLLFIDADDFLRHKDSIERIVSYAVANDYPDVIGFNISYYYPSRNVYVNWVEYTSKITNTTDKEILVQELVKSGTLPVSPCGKMIRLDSYRESGLSFQEGTIGEDIPWTIQLYDKMPKVRYMREYHYCYRQEVKTSVTGSFSEKKFMDLVAIIDDLVPLIRTSGFNEETKDCLYSFAGYELSIAISGVHRLSKSIKLDVRRKIKDSCWLLKYPQNPKVRMVNRVYNIGGYAITELALRLYNWYRTLK